MSASVGRVRRWRRRRRRLTHAARLFDTKRPCCQNSRRAAPVGTNRKYPRQLIPQSERDELPLIFYTINNSPRSLIRKMSSNCFSLWTVKSTARARRATHACRGSGRPRAGVVVAARINLAHEQVYPAAKY
ncbi:hypothetical protein EVAR_9044_1 [Eumeta japonica]|uniref:Uncharacterized protein n=1 Tax=Eumeta variegata TaxID=151549 RepID=A0A4C1TVX8_EUMVA|nr:hypothetical protein EVAR_9044_1 [Eumeta japonica]